MHADPELLGLLALGEHAGTDAERVHVQTCPECAHELSELHRVTTVARSISAETTMASPSPAVWARIQHELGFDASPEPLVDASTFPHVGMSEPSGVRAVKAPAVAPTEGRSARRPVLAMIKAALDRSSRDADDELTARAQLTPVDALWSQASGTAELATDELGRRLLQVTLRADLPTAGVRQAWLVHRDDPNVRQSLGVLDGQHGLWTVEHSIDLQQYAILDISQQDTGETEHSGQTIVRGDLTLVS